MNKDRINQLLGDCYALTVKIHTDLTEKTGQTNHNETLRQILKEIENRVNK